MSSSYELFGDWVAAIKKSCAQSSNWKIIDDWCYSTMTNPTRGAQKLYHLCDGSHRAYLREPNTSDTEQVTLMEHTTCISCGVLIPEGIKMIVMLLESGL